MILYLEYVLDFWSFAVIKLSENGTVVPKHVAIGTWHELCLMICILYFTKCIWWLLYWM